MKIAVIGAGVVGITSAYELARDGHQVSVFEQNAAIAEEASFANTSLLAPSLLHPLAHSPWPGQSLIQRLRTDSSGIVLTRDACVQELLWLLRWKKNPGAEVFMQRFALLQQLLTYGLQRQHAISKAGSISCEQSQGQLALLHSEAALHALQPKLAALQEAGVPFKTMTPQQAHALEPGLDPAYPMHAALHFPNDEVINCRQFSHHLKDLAVELGVQFRFGARIASLQVSPTPGLSVAGGADTEHFDHILLCTGAAAAVAGFGGGKLPLTTVHSYSVSVPVKDALSAPRNAVFDARTGINVVPMGSRIRVSGGANLGSKPGPSPQSATRALFQVLQSCFPGAATFQTGTQIWKGGCAHTPDTLPLLGATSMPGIWLNLGHGHNGWGMACGCARILADLIGQKTTAFASTALNPKRFQL